MLLTSKNVINLTLTFDFDFWLWLSCFLRPRQRRRLPLSNVALLLIHIQQSWHNFCADFPHAQIFGDNLPNNVLSHVRLTCNHSNRSTAHRWPQSCSLKASRSWSRFSPLQTPLWTTGSTQKHRWAKWSYLHKLAEAFQVFEREISTAGLKISGLFDSWCSSFVPQWAE